MLRVSDPHLGARNVRWRRRSLHHPWRVRSRYDAVGRQPQDRLRRSQPAAHRTQPASSGHLVRGDPRHRRGQPKQRMRRSPRRTAAGKSPQAGNATSDHCAPSPARCHYSDEIGPTRESPFAESLLRGCPVCSGETRKWAHPMQILSYSPVLQCHQRPLPPGVTRVVSSAIASGEDLKERRTISSPLCRDFATSISSDAP